MKVKIQNQVFRKNKRGEVVGVVTWGSPLDYDPQFRNAKVFKKRKSK